MGYGRTNKPLICSGADIASLVREASTEALRENIENKDSGNPVVKNSHFEVALTKVFPSVSRQVGLY